MQLALSAIRNRASMYVCVWVCDRERESMLSKGFELVWQLFSSLFSPSLLSRGSGLDSPPRAIDVSIPRVLWGDHRLAAAENKCEMKRGTDNKRMTELGRRRVKGRKIGTDSNGRRRQLKITSSGGRDGRGKGRRGATESANQANDLNL